MLSAKSPERARGDDRARRCDIQVWLLRYKRRTAGSMSSNLDRYICERSSLRLLQYALAKAAWSASPSPRALMARRFGAEPAIQTSCLLAPRSFHSQLLRIAEVQGRAGQQLNERRGERRGKLLSSPGSTMAAPLRKAPADARFRSWGPGTSKKGRRTHQRPRDWPACHLF